SDSSVSQSCYKTLRFKALRKNILLTTPGERLEFYLMGLFGGAQLGRLVSTFPSTKVGALCYSTPPRCNTGISRSGQQPQDAGGQNQKTGGRARRLWSILGMTAGMRSEVAQAPNCARLGGETVGVNLKGKTKTAPAGESSIPTSELLLNRAKIRGVLPVA